MATGTAEATQATGQASAGNRWINGPWVDLLIGCGGWALPLMAVTWWASQHDARGMALAFYALALFCNNPHYMATLYRAYGTRSDFEKYRFFTVYVGVIFVLTVLLVHGFPWLLPLFMGIYLTWSPWHYAGQNFGLAQMMARRNGARPEPDTRNYVYAAFTASYLVWILDLHSASTSHPDIVTLAIPEALGRPLQAACILGFGVCAVVGLRRLVSQCGWRRMVPTLMLFATQFLWFILPTLLGRFSQVEVPTSYYNAGVLALMHCAQYLWITTYYAKREHEQGLRGDGRPWSPWRYYAILVFGGIALFVPGPWLASKVFGADLFISLFIFMALVNIHHFILDGAIWKLRDGRIARLLLGNQRAGAHDHDADAATRKDLYEIGRWIFGRGRAAQITRIACILGLGGVAVADQLQNFATQPERSRQQAGAAWLPMARSINPNDSRVPFLEGRARAEEGDLQAALERFREAERLNPHRYAIQEEIGRTLAGLGRHEEALARFSGMRETFGPLLPVLSQQLALGVLTGNYETAIAAGEELLDRYPAEIDHRASLAEAYQRAGQPEKALEHYNGYLEAIEADPERPIPPERELLVHLQMASLLDEIGRVDDAIEGYVWIANRAVDEAERLAPDEDARRREFFAFFETARQRLREIDARR